MLKKQSRFSWHIKRCSLSIFTLNNSAVCTTIHGRVLWRTQIFTSLALYRLLISDSKWTNNLLNFSKWHTSQEIIYCCHFGRSAVILRLEICQSANAVCRKMSNSNSNADLVVVFHSSTNCVSQNAGRTFSNRKREAASRVVCCQLLLPSPASILNCRRQKAYRTNMTILDSPEKRNVPFKTVEALILPVVVEWLQIVSDYVTCWATQVT
jgi:hypothetical protein